MWQRQASSPPALSPFRELRMLDLVDAVRGVMGSDICGSYRNRATRDLPLVCVLAAGHHGEHRFTGHHWSD